MTPSDGVVILELHMTLLVELREQQGKTQEQVALDLGIGESTLSRHERGKTTPTRLQIIGYATYYGVDPDSIEQPKKPTARGRRAA